MLRPPTLDDSVEGIQYTIQDAVIELEALQRPDTEILDGFFDKTLDSIEDRSVEYYNATVGDLHKSYERNN